MKRKILPRCNEKAVWYSPANGFRACRCHVRPGMLLCAEAGPEPFGPCDQPVDYGTDELNRLHELETL